MTSADEAELPRQHERGRAKPAQLTHARRAARGAAAATMASGAERRRAARGGGRRGGPAAAARARHSRRTTRRSDAHGRRGSAERFVDSPAPADDRRIRSAADDAPEAETIRAACRPAPTHEEAAGERRRGIRRARAAPDLSPLGTASDAGRRSRRRCASSRAAAPAPAEQPERAAVHVQVAAAPEVAGPPPNPRRGWWRR